MKIYIVRHGETQANKESRLQGRIDEPLNEMGIFLARETGKALSSTKFDACFSSPLSRAKDTAAIILSESGNDTEIQIDERIAEINLGNLEGKKMSEIRSSADSEIVENFFTNPSCIPAFNGGESVRDVMTRTQKFLFELARKSYDSVLVSTHGCALRCMLNFLYEDHDDFWHGHCPYNCCLNIVEVKDGKLSLIADDEILYDKTLCVDRYKRS